jgi:zeaxanthin glucosyltransferase
MNAQPRLWRFGVLSFTGTGHLNPLISLSQCLTARGHQVTFFEKPKIEGRIREAGLNFFPIEKLRSNGRRRRLPNKGGVWSELSTMFFNIRRVIDDLELFLTQTPPAILSTGVDALLINEIAATGPTVAQMLHLPYFIISTSVPHNFGWNGFRGEPGFRYTTSWVSPLQRALLEVSALRLRGPIRYTLDRYRRGVGLGPIRDIQRVFPELAHITQLPQCLDLPQSLLAENFHYTGPFVTEAARPPVSFPWECLDGRPIVYASLGTTRNIQPAVFRMIAKACHDLDVQLVISLGGRLNLEVFSDLPGHPVIRNVVPQLELLKVAKVVITHGGPNTVLETLLEGKPMIVIPIAHDQPAIAARLARLGLAKVLPVMRLSAKMVRSAVVSVLDDPGYRDAALEMQAKLRSIRGGEQAVAIIEEAMEKYAARRHDLEDTSNLRD